MSRAVSDKPEMKVWKLNDCDWVAAASLAEAVEWYRRTIHDEVDEDIEECSLATKMTMGEPGDPDAKKCTFREAIAMEKEFPCIIASTEY